MQQYYKRIIRFLSKNPMKIKIVQEMCLKIRSLSMVVRQQQRLNSAKVLLVGANFEDSLLPLLSNVEKLQREEVEPHVLHRPLFLPEVRVPGRRFEKAIFVTTTTMTIEIQNVGERRLRRPPDTKLTGQKNLLRNLLHHESYVDKEKKNQ